MSCYININDGFVEELTRGSFTVTINFMKMWADKMKNINPEKYQFDIIYNILKFWEENGFITKRQYQVLRNFWFKWRIYKTEFFLGSKPVSLWYEDNYDHFDVSDSSIGFPEDDEYPFCLEKQKVVSKCMIKPKYACLGEAFNNYSPSSDKKIWY